MASCEDIRVSVRDRTGLIELDRPDRANAYRDATLAAFVSALEAHLRSQSARVIVVASTTGNIFCAGADLDELGRRGAADALRLRSREVFDRLAACPKPTIAAIDGPAVAGGLELALACDLRIATPRARFGMPETSLGLIPAAGATYRLPRVVGEAVAKRMILFGAELDAEQALGCGLVDEVTGPDELAARVARWAERAAGRDPVALELAKRAVAMAASDRACRAFTSSAQAMLYERRHRRDDEVP